MATIRAITTKKKNSLCFLTRHVSCADLVNHCRQQQQDLKRSIFRSTISNQNNYSTLVCCDSKRTRWVSPLQQKQPLIYTFDAVPSCCLSSTSASPLRSFASLSSSLAEEADNSNSGGSRYSSSHSYSKSPEQQTASEERRFNNQDKNRNITLEQVAEETRALLQDYTFQHGDHGSDHRLQEDFLYTWNKAIENSKTALIVNPKAYVEHLNLLHEFAMRCFIATNGRQEVGFKTSKRNLAAQVAMGGWKKYGAYLDGKLAVEKAWSLVNPHPQQRVSYQEASSSIVSLPAELHASHAKQRKRLYHGLLLVVRRSTSISLRDNKSIKNENPVRAEDAARMALQILNDMKHEEDKMASSLYRIVDVQTYNHVMAAHALAEDVDSIEGLWRDCVKRLNLDLQPRAAGYYEALILAYQHRFEQQIDPQLRKQIALKAWEAWRKHLDEYPTTNHSSTHRPLGLTLRRVLWMLQQIDNHSTAASRGYYDSAMSHVRQFVDVHPECSEIITSSQFGIINRKGRDVPPVSLNDLEGFPDIGVFDTKSFGILLQHYCRSSTTLKKAEQLLKQAEEQTLSSPADNQHDNLLDSCIPYNILMTGYLKSFSRDIALHKIESTIKRLEKLGADHPQFLPDEVSYTIWLSALLNSTRPSRFDEADSILLTMETSERAALKPTSATYTALFNLWSRYEMPYRLQRTTEIFHRLADDVVDANVFRAYIRLCRQIGAETEALQAWERLMSISQHEQGQKVRDIQLYPQICTLVVECLDRSKAPDKYEKARRVFQDMLELERGNKVSFDCAVFQELKERMVRALLKCLSSSTTMTRKLTEIQWIRNNVDDAVLVHPRSIEVLLGVCASCDDKSEAWETCKQFFEAVESTNTRKAEELKKEFRGDALYVALLRTCFELLSSPSSSSSSSEQEGKRIQYDCTDELRGIFFRCVQAGLVSDQVLVALRQCLLPLDPYQYLRLTLQDPKATRVNLAAIPWHWQRNL